ncbi:MAG: CPBP family glutamic-type intramembrane protease [Candidatus Bathyarchaeota archaeon]|nr:CPBP family glutamic-type intramembrane protease [Candidatus Bathyarchaeota archaeon]MDH5494803.1 CPBP family glutamic-type intramembrane protease [Candidatus Bathyarchaeota archaeon]
MNSNLSETLQRFLFAIVLVISFFIVFTYLLSMGLGILVFFSTAEGLKFSQDTIPLHPLFIIDVTIPVNVGLYFIFLWWVFALCFAAAWKYRKSLSRARESFSSAAKQSPFSNNLLAMPLITSMLLVATIVLNHLQTQGGIPTGSIPISDPFLGFLIVSRAPLVEEIIFRIIPIGTFLVTYIFLAGKRTRPDFSWSQRLKTSILSVLQPEKAKETVDLKTIGKGGLFGGVIWAEWVMVFLTASLFGIAHYFGGWEPGKISQAAMSGAVFALAYLYYGVQAPILLHWYFNYYFTVFDLSSSYYSAEVDFAYFLAVSTNLFLGILMWIAVMIFSIITIFKVLRRKPKPIPVPEPPSFASL